MKMLNKTTLLAVAFGLATAGLTAQASLTSDSVSLADLSQGGTLSIGDKTFTGFGYTLDGALTSFNPSSIMVSASIGDDGVYYLTWSGNISLAGNTVATADLKLNYVVTASAGMISMIDQSYTGSTQNGLLSIAETVSSGSFGGPILATSSLTGSFQSEFTGDNLYVNPAQSTLYVTKDISLATLGDASLVTISQVSQSFHQTAVPEPSTVVAGALLLLPFGVSTLRILRKSKVS